MNTIINWLREIESRASEIYSAAAIRFADDEIFSSFLSQLAHDEMSHCHLLDRAAQNIADADRIPQFDIILDDETVAIVEGPLNELLSRLDSRKTSRQEIIEYIVKAELTEWNEVFLYIIHSCLAQSRDIQFAAAAIQAHEQRIKKFIKSLPEALRPYEDILQLPKIWDQNILIVDDDEPLRVLMSSVLSTLGRTETAENGKEAFEKIQENFYNVILSDIDMPEMDGMEFFQKAVEADNRLVNHFIICSGDLSVERREYLRQYSIPCLRKPFNIFELKNTAQRLIETAV